MLRLREHLCDFVPMTREEIDARGWEALDVLLISGDAHVDHPSFGVPLLARLLLDRGYRVAIVAQPPYPGSRAHGTDGPATREHGLAALRALGTPRLFVGIGTGVVDSMVNNYTANRRRRSDDSYAPGGQGGRRPDDAARVYAALARAAFPELPVVLGGVEASLRRLAHYDFWRNTVRRGLLFDTRADLLVFGMAEHALLAIAAQLSAAVDAGQAPIEALDGLRELPGTAWLADRDQVEAVEPRRVLPAFKEVRGDRKAFARATRLIEAEANPWSGRSLVQWQGRDAAGVERAVVVRPPALPLSTAELDAVHELPFTRAPHPLYLEEQLARGGNPTEARQRARIPALETVRHSIVINRGCFGGCSFCGLGLHQGKTIQSRSADSVLREVEALAKTQGFTGVVSDLGGPTANMYGLHCGRPEVEKHCRRPSCLYPSICRHLVTDHGALVKLMRRVRKHPKVKKALVASGLRTDLALRDRRYLRELLEHHVGGHLKVAPEHVDDEVLALMRKPGFEQFERFKESFEEISRELGKEQYLVPYFISCFPGSTTERMAKVEHWLRRERWRLQQVQAFIPLPMTMAAAMYWSGIDPVSGQVLQVPKSERERRQQQALLQPHRYAPRGSRRHVPRRPERPGRRRRV